MQRIIVTNAKGGCGKSTIATNLAAFLSAQHAVSLFDYDPQGSSIHWLKLRAGELPRINGVAAYRKPANGTTSTFHLRVPRDTDYVIADTPAGMLGQPLAQVVQNADVVLVPVLPSPIDIHAATRFIGELLLNGKARSRNVRIGVIANRVRTNTIMYQTLTRFLNTLNIPFVAALRDTQNYARAAQAGMGVAELNGPLVRRDTEQWRTLTRWLSEYRPAPVVSPADLGYRDAAVGKALWRKMAP